LNEKSRALYKVAGIKVLSATPEDLENSPIFIVGVPTSSESSDNTPDEHQLKLHNRYLQAMREMGLT
jgi:hypothetical protein